MLSLSLFYGNKKKNFVPEPFTETSYHLLLFFLNTYNRVIKFLNKGDVAAT